ncbi:MAG: phosphonate ABC transporter, permease protein PhnE [Sphingobium sp.]
MTGGTVATDPWRFPQPYGWRTLATLIAVLAVLLYSGKRAEIDRMTAMTVQAVLAPVGLAEKSRVADGLSHLARQMVPIQISDRQEVSRIEGFDPNRLPLFAHLETVRGHEEKLNPLTMKLESQPTESVWLVEPLGYVVHVAGKMLETLEIALWGTIVAVAIGLPLSLLSARTMRMPLAVRGVSNTVIALMRAVPELVSALFLVIAYGFGPIAGILALGLYGAGFLGKFYADDMENADPRPQEALVATGAGRLAVWRFAVLPQVMPQFIAYTLYILDRNMRMATVIGLVGAGGIGQELKGRYDLYEYGHVGTILIAIFLTVLLLDQGAARLRRAWL